jgi:hypothetical protein
MTLKAAELSVGDIVILSGDQAQPLGCLDIFDRETKLSPDYSGCLDEYLARGKLAGGLGIITGGGHPVVASDHSLQRIFKVDWLNSNRGWIWHYEKELVRP